MNDATELEEIAPALRLVWGATAPLMAKIIVSRPSVAARLSLMPTRAVHATAAFVQHATSKGMDVATVAQHVEHDHARDLLAEAISNINPRLYRLMDKLGTPAEPLDTYRRINTILSGPAAGVLIDIPLIDVRLVGMAERIAVDPVIYCARNAIERSEHDLNTLTSALSFLRATRLADRIEALPEGSGWRAICRRIEHDLSRAKSLELPFGPPRGWEHISDMAGLWKVGTELGNCVSRLDAGGEHYMRQFLRQQSIFLVTLDKPRILAEIESVGPMLWRVGCVAGDFHHQKPWTVQQKLAKMLRIVMSEAGHTLLDDDPLRAFSAIGYRAGKQLDDEELDQITRDLGDAR